MSRKDGKNTLSLPLKKVNPANATFKIRISLFGAFLELIDNAAP